MKKSHHKQCEKSSLIATEVNDASAKAQQKKRQKFLMFLRLSAITITRNTISPLIVLKRQETSYSLGDFYIDNCKRGD